MFQPGRLSRKIKKFCPQNAFWGLGWLWRRHLPVQKPSQKIEKLTFSGRRFKSPFFLWLIQILKAVAMGVVAVCGAVLVR
jgi:hypothetical protein